MRADRLLSLLMHLQSNGIMTARELSEELEVSERTIYRDVEALSIAGVPVYTERGPGGGVTLIESFRTNLTGLTTDEVQALFMLSIPAPLAQLGVSQELKTALLKLTAALPEAYRQEQKRSRQRIHLDSSWWFQADEAVPHLQVVQQALWKDRMLQLTYQSYFGAKIEQVVSPFGLVAKTNVWYLVYAWEGIKRALRVSHIIDVVILPETFERPDDFDLVAFWDDWCKEFEESRSYYPVIIRVSPTLLPQLAGYFGDRIQSSLVQVGPPDAEGWVTITYPFDSFEAARTRLLGFGRAVEVLEPEPLRKSVIDFAQQISNFYSQTQSGIVG
jgi:predicted DNA-binding transcriptional regulator YafY